MNGSTRLDGVATGLPDTSVVDAATAPSPARPVRNPPLAQIFLCKGCCCGQTERGRPPVPLEEFKAIWKADKLNKSVQLTVSGCLGPCKLANVVLVLSPGCAQWFGRLQSASDYSALISWAKECNGTGRLAPMPEPLQELAFERFAPGV